MVFYGTYAINLVFDIFFYDGKIKVKIKIEKHLNTQLDAVCLVINNLMFSTI